MFASIVHITEYTSQLMYICIFWLLEYFCIDVIMFIIIHLFELQCINKSIVIPVVEFH